MTDLSAVSRRKARDAVEEALRQAIIEGRVPPGVFLKEAEVAEALGVSRVPLREALRTLESDHLVTVVHGRGIQVARLDWTAISEEYEVRLCLEPRAAALACQRASLAEIAALKAVTEEVKAAIERKDFSSAAKRNADFHTLLIGLSQNRLMQRLCRHCWGSLRLALLLSKNETEPEVEPLNSQLESQHRELIQALEARDESRAEAIARQHILESYKYSLRLYEYAKRLLGE